MAKSEAAKLTERNYEIIRNPLVTEKTTMGSQYGQITFKVPTDATKPEIKTAVEALWKVKVEKVNTLIQKGKTKRFKGVPGRRSNFKKAIVKLAEGQTIDFSEGVK
ncbi:MAG: 50S ribosomal protein L23 [Alphaproteobacteria bacterium]|nr:50S ribosomal protein L23 [Alphaproteobacteria bacterium]